MPTQTHHHHLKIKMVIKWTHPHKKETHKRNQKAETSETRTMEKMEVIKTIKILRKDLTKIQSKIRLEGGVFEEIEKELAPQQSNCMSEIYLTLRFLANFLTFLLVNMVEIMCWNAIFQQKEIPESHVDSDLLQCLRQLQCKLLLLGEYMKLKVGC